MLRQANPLRALGVLAIAAAGAALALLGAAALGKLGERTTIQQVSPLPGGGVGQVALAPTSGNLSVEEIYRRSAPGVVQITATTVRQQSDPFNVFPQQQQEQALGSGFVIDKEGHVVTNFHVVQNAQRVQVSFSANDQLDAKVVGSDPSTDIAVLRIDAHSRSLTPLPLGDSDKVTVGDAVVAIGNPFGLARTATAGIVSAVQRRIEAPNRAQIEHAIQTDAAINHGNSGGPLIDRRAQVIGVNAQITTSAGGEQGSSGIGFAIPINTVKTVATQLIRSGKVDHAFLGTDAKPITEQLLKLFSFPTRRGLLVQDVTTGSGAEKAGLKAGTTPVVVEGDSYQLGGDIIVAADGKPTSTFEDLRNLVARKKPGDSLSLQIYRDGKKKTVTVELGRQPPSPGG